jgi:hypothetical protein
MSEIFHVNLSFSDPVVLEKNIFKVFPYINTCENSFPYCGTTPSPGVMKFKKNLFCYIIKLSYKFWSFIIAHWTFLKYIPI